MYFEIERKYMGTFCCLSYLPEFHEIELTDATFLVANVTSGTQVALELNDGTMT
jgi:hypothetical protein